MIFLQVLNGLHANASVAMGRGRYRIAKPDDLGAIREHDEQVTAIGLFDWTSAPLELQLTADGGVLQVADNKKSSHMAADVWAMEKPRKFGAISLRISRSEFPNGCDFADTTQFRSSACERQQGRRWYGTWGTRAGLVGIALLAAVTALYGHTGGPVPASLARPDLDAEWLQRSLAARGLHELRVRRERDDIVLSGLVRDAVQAQSAYLALAEFARGSEAPVVKQWEVAEDIASTIEAALRHSGVRARYVGVGRFQVSGMVEDPGAIKAAGDSLRKDLGQNVQILDFDLTTRSHHDPVNAAVAADALRYSERADGAKVFSKKFEGL